MSIARTGRKAEGGKRSSADFTFCCVAIDHFKRAPEETAAKLQKVSGKARENGEAHALDPALSTAAKVAVKCGTVGRAG
jgi:hypothetical protein